MAKINEYKFRGTGLNTLERKTAKRRFDKYRKNYHIEKFSDLTLLEEKVFREIQQDKAKKKIGEISKKTEIAPQHLLDFLDKNITKILEIDDKLGLYKINQDKENGYKYFQTLKKKFQIWMDNNQGSRTLICPHCSNMIMLKIKTDIWEAQKHPFFKDRFLTNEHLIKLFKEKKITKEDCAKILQVSEDYILWLIEKWYQDK